MTPTALHLTRKAKGRRAVVLLVLAGVLVAGLVATGCSGARRGKGTFVGQAEGVRQSPDVPVGLNPLGSLDICLPGMEASAPTHRVLVSPPEYFTPEATHMILRLREALAEGEDTPPDQPMELWLAGRRLGSVAEAAAEGRRCGALIALWEPEGTHSLELTLPYPTTIPLRHLVHERLCEFGSHEEQLTILYLTIVGLAATLDNRYDGAVYYMETADRVDDHCLRLPHELRPVAED